METAKVLLAMTDGGIVNIETDSDYTSGCETCDYGSSYINEFTLYMTSGNIYVKSDSEYSYAMSDGYMMQLILPNVDEIKQMTEDQFFEWLKEQLNSSFNCIEICQFNKK